MLKTVECKTSYYLLLYMCCMYAVHGLHIYRMCAVHLLHLIDYII